MLDFESEAPRIASNHPRRLWPVLAALGVALISLALIVVALVIFAKPQFGWLVGSMFVEVITSGVMVGSLVLLVGAWNLPERKSWRGITLLVWGIVALTSPAFGIMFLLPWGLLALSFPVVLMILIRLLRSEQANRSEPRQGEPKKDPPAQ